MRSVVHAKAQAAVDALPLLLDRMAAGEAGTPQSGPARYFSRPDAEGIIDVPYPLELTAEDLRRRTRAFGTVERRHRRRPRARHALPRSEARTPARVLHPRRRPPRAGPHRRAPRPSEPVEMITPSTSSATVRHERP